MLAPQSSPYTARPGRFTGIRSLLDREIAAKIIRANKLSANEKAAVESGPLVPVLVNQLKFVCQFRKDIPVVVKSARPFAPPA